MSLRSLVARFGCKAAYVRPAFNVRPLTARSLLPRNQAAQPQASLTSRTFFTSSPRNARYVKFNPERPYDIRQWDTGTKVLVGLALGGGVYYVTHLEQVPETGRWRFMDINPKFETELAKAAYDQLVNEFRGKVLHADHPVTRHVRKVVTRILEANNLGTLRSSDPRHHQISSPADVWGGDSEFDDSERLAPGTGGREWDLIVVNDDKVVNAAASYGNIIVFTGILPVAKDEQGLSAVLGHEIAHVVARHNSERYSSAKVLIAFASLLAVLGLDLGLANFISTLLLELPNSCTQELEADKIGLKLVAKACYDPRAAPIMFRRLGQLEKSQGKLNVSFLYTHPTSEQRVKLLEEMLPEAYAIQAATPECSRTYEQASAFRDAFASGFGSSIWV